MNDDDAYDGPVGCRDPPRPASYKGFPRFRCTSHPIPRPIGVRDYDALTHIIVWADAALARRWGPPRNRSFSTRRSP